MKGIKIDRRDIGLNFLPGGEADIRLWSPLSDTIELVLPDTGKTYPLVKEPGGYWRLTTPEIKPGEYYQFAVNEKQPLPDPASLAQAKGVHGPSLAVDLTAYSWNDSDWQNFSLDQYIFYELHTGTFTPGGTFNAIEQKLDHLKELGITAVEIMPVAQFPGGRNWGYDGVFPFAVQDTYGGASGLQKLVDACHRKGMAVVLDVVYNHLGPEGNYFNEFGPYFTEKYKTPWGSAINFDDAWCDGVRDYFIENALMWFRDFHIDALRLDAVHAIKDFSPTHILAEIKEHVDRLMEETGRTHYLIVELDLNDTRFINPQDKGGYGMDAQWIDEFHHALRVSSGGSRTGYYEDFERISHLAKAYQDAYVYDGQFSPHRKKLFGIKAGENPGKQFIVFSQNHDQVGNRMLGERTSELVSFEMQKLLAGAVFISPYLPLLFMGEEWREPHPFLYFISHTDQELVEAVRKGRRQEFAAFHLEGEAPDPAAKSTFELSKLQWNLLNAEPHQTMFRFYKALINIRKSQPALNRLNRKQLLVKENLNNQTLQLSRWHNNQQVLCFLNFSGQQQELDFAAGAGGHWTKLLDSADPRWGGPEVAPESISGSMPGDKIIVQPESLLIYSATHV